MKLGKLANGRYRYSRPPLDNLLSLAEARARMEDELQLVPRGGGGIVLHPLAPDRFGDIVEQARAVVQETAADSQSTIESSDDPYAFHWLILRTSQFGELVEGVHTISATLESGGWWPKLLCAVFPFEDERGRPVYWTYNYKWGAFSPIAPGADGQYRDGERERLLASELATDLAVEAHLGTWFPLRGVPL